MSKQLVTEFLEARKQMTLATVGEHPWICNLFYVIDADLNFYFLSALDTLHVQQLQIANQVAISIADAPQLASSKKKAVQLWGTAERLTDVGQIEWFVHKWADNPAKYPAADLAVSDVKAVFKVTTQLMKYYNQELFDNHHNCVLIEV
jgi:uncharacterized protein YhbP (UPF0306 family)